MDEDVENILLALAKGAETFAVLSGQTAVGTALAAATGLIEGLVALLEHRTPEEVKNLIYDLAAHPAAKADLSDLSAEVAAIIAERRREETDRE